MNSRPFTVGIASGKGGTGKTSVATSLARVATERGRSVILVDGDVDAPNAALFLPAEIADSRVVSALIPEVDPSVCTLCGDCFRACHGKFLEYRVFGLRGDRARSVFIVVVVALHATFLGVARI